MATTPPEVTIGIPTYNRSAMLERCLRMILSQTFRDLRVIVVDNASTDATREIVASLQDARITYVRNPSNVGMTGNWNRCLDLAVESASPFIGIYFDDDRYARTIVEREVRFLKERPDAGFVHTAMHYLNLAQGRYRPAVPYPYDRVITARELLDDLCLKGLYHINTPSVLIRREAVLEAGRFDPAFRICPDLDLWWRILDHSSMGYIAEPLVVQTVHPQQTSSSSEALEKALTQGESLEVVRRALKRMRELRPDWDHDRYERLVLRFFALEILKTGRSALLTPHRHIASRACREALRLSPSAEISLRAALLRLMNHPPGRLAARLAASIRNRWSHAGYPPPGFESTT